MPDWKKYVRERLRLASLRPERAAELADDVAAQLEAAYELARSRGASETEAFTRAESEIPDWTQFSREVEDAEQRHMPALEERGLNRLNDSSSAQEQPKGRSFMFRDLLADLLYAVRVLRKSPGFTATAIVTLALGIGLNTALFSVVNTVLFQPLPVERPEELVSIWNRGQGGIVTHEPIAFPDFRDIREQSTHLTGAFGYALEPYALDTGDASEIVVSETATGDYFTTLGVRAALGRMFTRADEEGPDAAPVVVLSYGAWQRRFGGEPSILGRSLRLNGTLYTVIGVAQPEFTGLYKLFAADLWVPMRWTGERRRSDLNNRGGRWMMAMGRLKPGATFAQAQAEAEAIGKRLKEQYPETNRNREVGLVRANDVMFIPGLEKVLYPVSGVLLGVVGLVLLIASANVANMLLARATARRKEFAVRLALGAARGRLVRQLLAESMLLALAGGAMGLGMAVWSNGALVSAMNRMQIPIPITFTLGPALDGPVLGYTLGLAFLTTLAFGLAPALQASRADLATTLKEESGTTAGGGRKRGLQKTLVVAQVALSLVLLIGAGLSLRSLFQANRIDPGFRTQGVAKIALSTRLAGYKPEQSRAFFDQLLERVRALPGVQSAALASHLPLTFEVRNTTAVKDGEQSTPIEQRPEVDVSTAGPGYFETMDIRIVRGRGFEERDILARRSLAVINETLAAQFWPGQDPIGQRIHLGRDEQPWEVIGVASNAKYRTLGEDPRPYVYQGYDPQAYNEEIVIARTNRDAASLLAVLRQSARSIDEKVPIMGLQTLEQATSVSLLLPRAGASLFGLFGLLGLTLASVGLYGVIAYLVSQRTHEIGIRMALGAQRMDILKLVVAQGLRLTLVGVLLGLAGAFAVTRVLSVILYGISPTDGVTFAGVALVLLVTTLLACYIPARRAARVDPMIALRYE